MLLLLQVLLLLLTTTTTTTNTNTNTTTTSTTTTTTGVSTTDTCFILKEVMNKYSKCKKSGIITFVDISKAFDQVDHFMLGNKLLERNIPVDIIFILMHYFRNQQAKVVWKNASSDYLVIENSVRQGGILSPFLFKFYIDNIIHDISLMEEGCTLGITRVNILAYADDIVLITESVCEMSSLYARLCTSIRDHKLSINLSKCLIFEANSSIVNSNVLNLGGDDLEAVSVYKYLGHMIEGNLSDTRDVEFRLNKFYANINSILRNFKHADVNTLLFLFSAYCKPVYGLSLWNNRATYSRCIFKTFEVAYSNAFKFFLGVPLYASNHITADICSQLLLRHQIATLQCNYYQ